MKRLFTSHLVSYEEIGEQLGVSSYTIYRYAKKFQWPRKRKRPSVRSYRKIAEFKIGRVLQRGEHVHHIDGDRNNSAPINLHVFANGKMHAKSHADLERCAFRLVRSGVIKFDEEAQTYVL